VIESQHGVFDGGKHIVNQPRQASSIVLPAARTFHIQPAQLFDQQGVPVLRTLDIAQSRWASALRAAFFAA